MVEHGDVEHFAGSDKQAGGGDVLRAGRGIGAGMVMDDDDGGRIGADCGRKYFCDPDDCRVDAALVHRGDFAQVVFGVEHQNA